MLVSGPQIKNHWVNSSQSSGAVESYFFLLDNEYSRQSCFLLSLDCRVAWREFLCFSFSAFLQSGFLNNHFFTVCISWLEPFINLMSFHVIMNFIVSCLTSHITFGSNVQTQMRNICSTWSRYQIRDYLEEHLRKCGQQNTCKRIT